MAHLIQVTCFSLESSVNRQRSVATAPLGSTSTEENERNAVRDDETANSDSMCKGELVVPADEKAKGSWRDASSGSTCRGLCHGWSVSAARRASRGSTSTKSACFSSLWKQIVENFCGYAACCRMHGVPFHTEI